MLVFEIDPERMLAAVLAVARRVEGVAEPAARAVLADVQRDAEALAEARIAHSSPGGFADSFRIETDRVGPNVLARLVNVAPHAPYVEEGRPAGEPVEKAYVDNAENRRRGRVGATYVSHYTGMPPSGIFGDGLPDWARRTKIARDGYEGKGIVRDVRRRYPPRTLISMLGREIIARARA